MKYLELINEVFVNPFGQNVDKTRKKIDAVIDQLLEFLHKGSESPLLPQSLDYAFKDKVLNQVPHSFDQIVNSINVMLNNSMNPTSPYYIGHMDSMSTLFSFLGDMIASAINNNMFSLEMSPFLTQLEYKIVSEFCHIFGYDEQAGGLVLGGGSLANLQALIVARNQALGSSTGALQSKAGNLVILCSSMAHVSIKKSAMILGVGMENVLAIPVDEKGHMDTDKLVIEIKEAIQKGQKVMAVVATAGSTVTGNIDPVNTIADITERYGIWLHVDAVWGGGLILSGKFKGRINGIQKADSITFNPQKWMMVAKTCSLVLFKNRKQFEEYFNVKKNYVKEQHIATDLSEIGIPGTKRADVLKLWLSIQSFGLKGYEMYIEHTMKMVKLFVAKIALRDYLCIKYQPETAMICVRSQPSWLPATEWDNWNIALQNYLLTEKNIFVSLPKLNGESCLRIILLNPFLDEHILDEILLAFDEFHFKQSGK